MLRSQRAALVRQLLAEGHPPIEAARLAGISRSYLHQLLSDPDGARVRERRSGYGRCRDCGGPVNGAGGRRGAPERCRECSLAKQRAATPWPPERVISALKAWVSEHGHAPTVSELGPVNGLPSYSTLVTRFGTAAAAFAAAGIERVGPGKHATVWSEAAREAAREAGRRGAAIRRARQRENDATRPPAGA